MGKNYHTARNVEHACCQENIIYNVQQQGLSELRCAACFPFDRACLPDKSLPT